MGEGAVRLARLILAADFARLREPVAEAGSDSPLVHWEGNYNLHRTDRVATFG